MWKRRAGCRSGRDEVESSGWHEQYSDPNMDMESGASAADTRTRETRMELARAAELTRATRGTDTTQAFRRACERPALVSTYSIVKRLS
jgi:hypothetical protein